MKVAKLKSEFGHNILNIPGWRTKRKIVVIESDDWGSIRMPSKEAYNHLLKSGIRVDKCHYCRYDSLESENDIAALYEVLQSVKDKNGKTVKITANTVVANPEFEKIKASDFCQYNYEIIDKSYLRFKNCSKSLDLLKEGNNSGLISIQSHGREHLNVNRWMNHLKSNNKETRIAFDYGVYGISTTITSERRKSFLQAFDFETSEENVFVNEIAKSGLEIFEELFKYKSESFIAPNYTWGRTLEKMIMNKGVKYLQGTQLHRYTSLNKKKERRRIRFTGRTNQHGQIDLARNAFFEPSENKNKDWVNSCLKDINNAFFWKHPAIICSHRVNFVNFKLKVD